MLLALIWVGFLAVRPVHIPVLIPSAEVVAHRAQSLSGVQGQTFIAPTGGLSRIDLDVSTHIPPGEWVHLRFELARGVLPRTTLAMGTVVFDRSRLSWPVSLTVAPDLTAKGDRLYLRIESILSSGRAVVAYYYSRQDIDPHGAFLNRDQPRATNLDLLMTVYRAPSVPKPLAWIEALTARAGQAAQLAALAPAWVVTLVGTLTLAAALSAVAAGVRLLLRIGGWHSTWLTTPAIVALLGAAALTVLAWGENPIGKVVLDLT